MSQRLAHLAERRRRLVALAAGQRVALARDLAPWRPRLARIDQGVAMLRSLGRHPVLLTGAALLLAAVRAPRAGKWLRRGWVMWQIGRRLRGR